MKFPLKTYFFLYKKAATMLFVLIIVISSCTKQEITYVRGDLTAVFSKAKKENKKVFILISNSLCGRCEEFENFLNTQENTVNLLRKDYISYKADIQKASEHEIAEILKNPSYPFPYFFDADGNLLTFGFPNSPEYDITKLGEIRIEERPFEEMFRLAIGTNQYKTLVSMNLKAALLLASKKKADTFEAAAIIRKSLDIAKYPYNVRNNNLFSTHPYLNVQALDLVNYTINGSDQFLYGDIRKYMLLKNQSDDALGQRSTTQSVYQFADDGKNMGRLIIGKKYPFSFKIKNISTRAMKLLDVNHPCDCIQLEWEKNSIEIGATTTVNGSFTPYQSGDFIKDIFIHSDSKLQSMTIYQLNGTVK